MDGTPTLRMNEFILAALAHGKIDLGPARTDINAGVVKGNATANTLDAECANMLYEGLPEPVELEFVVNDEIKDLVKGAEERFDKLVGEHELQVGYRTVLNSWVVFPHNVLFCFPLPIPLSLSSQVLHYPSYGKSLIKKFNASPDAWAQLVKHLAFYKMFNRLAVTYESAQTRKYQLGRTEVIRSASNEVKEWVESMGREGTTVSYIQFFSL